MSDQDFFFDEDEKPAEKPASKSADKPASKSGSSAKSAAAAPAVMGERTVTMTVAALIGVVTLLLGVIIGLFVAPDGGKVASPSSTATGQTNGSAAPQLTDEQIQQGLPEGHPTIPQDMGSGESTVTTAPAE